MAVSLVPQYGDVKLMHLEYVPQQPASLEAIAGCCWSVAELVVCPERAQEAGKPTSTPYSAPYFVRK